MKLLHEPIPGVTGYFDEKGCLHPQPALVPGVLFEGMVQGSNSAAFTQVELVTQDCRTQGRVENLALIGVPSTGKTTTALRVAAALERPIYEGSALNFEGDPFKALFRVLDKTLGPFPEYLCRMDYPEDRGKQMGYVRPCVVFIDEAHDLPKSFQTLMLSALEKPYRITCDVGGLDLTQVMWIIGTTDISFIQKPLQLRFTPVPFIGYSIEDVALMVRMHYPDLERADCERIARAGKGYPRSAFKVAKMVAMQRRNSACSVQEALHVGFGMDDNGLDVLDQKILEVLRGIRAISSPARLAEAEALINAAADGKKVSATTLVKAHALMQVHTYPAPIARKPLCEKLQYTNESDLMERVVYLETLGLVRRIPSRGIQAVL